MKTYHREYRSPVVAIGRYRCRHGTVAMGPEQQSQHFSISITQRGAFGLCRAGRHELIDRSVAALFNIGDVYRTDHPDLCDDDGFYVFFDREVLVDVLGRYDGRVRDRPEQPFRHVTVPLPARAMLLAAGLLRDIPGPTRGDGCEARDPSISPAPDAASSLEIDERALEFLDTLFAAAPAAAPAAREVQAREARIAPAHRELADAARRQLVLRFAEHLTLTDLAAALGVSPFHLCRVFRRVTGRTLHAQLESHRLGAALDAITDSRADLSRVALACGFASHSHFTARFRRAFGLTPSEFRRARS